MKMNPIQKYAMRLLIASGQVQIPDRVTWMHLTSETAEKYLGQFGGVQSVLQDTVLSRQKSSAKESQLSVSSSISFSSRKKSEFER